MRLVRLEIEGGCYYVSCYSCGSESVLFRDDEERTAFLGLLSSAVARYSWTLYAYCLLPDHVHLVLEAPKGTLSRGMATLQSSYASQVNRRRSRRGCLFNGRFHAVIVEKETYLAPLCRHVLLNPVRTGLCERLADWAWSSHYAGCGDAAPVAGLSLDWIDELFPSADHYCAYVLEGAGEDSPLLDRRGRIFLGSDSFVDRVAGQSR